MRAHFEFRPEAEKLFDLLPYDEAKKDGLIRPMETESSSWVSTTKKGKEWISAKQDELYYAYLRDYAAIEIWSDNNFQSPAKICVGLSEALITELKKA